MAVRVLKKFSRKERRTVCVRCGKTLVYESGDIITGDDGLCYILCPNQRCRRSNYVGTQDVRQRRRV